MSHATVPTQLGFGVWETSTKLSNCHDTTGWKLTFWRSICSSLNNQKKANVQPGLNSLDKDYERGSAPAPNVQFIARIQLSFLDLMRDLLILANPLSHIRTAIFGSLIQWTATSCLALGGIGAIFWLFLRSDLLPFKQQNIPLHDRFHQQQISTSLSFSQLQNFSSALPWYLQPL